MKNKKLTPMQVIRKKCLECQGNRYSLIRNCENTDGPLHPYRLGKRPSNNAACAAKVGSKQGSFINKT